MILWVFPVICGRNVKFSLFSQLNNQRFPNKFRKTPKNYGFFFFLFEFSYIKCRGSCFWLFFCARKWLLPRKIPQNLGKFQKIQEIYLRMKRAFLDFGFTFLLYPLFDFLRLLLVKFLEAVLQFLSTSVETLRKSMKINGKS